MALRLLDIEQYLTNNPGLVIRVPDPTGSRGRLIPPRAHAVFWET